MARQFQEGSWVISRNADGSPSTVSVSGTFTVSDGTNMAQQTFATVDDWSSLPGAVRQAIGDAWQAYHDWLQTRRAAGEL